MPRKSEEKSLLIGFFGSGEVKADEVDALLNSYMETAPEDTTFLFPVTKTHWNDTLAAVADWALEVDPPVPYIVVTDEESARSRNLSKYLKGGETTHTMARVPQKIIGLLDAADDAILGIAWDDDDNDLQSLCARAVEKEIPVHDLTTGFNLVDFEEDEKKDDGGDKDKDDEPEEKSGRSRGRKSDDEPEPEAKDDEPADDKGGDSNEWDPYTREEMEGVIAKHEEKPAEALKVLRAIADDYGLEIPPRTRATTIIDEIIKHQDRVEKERAKTDEMLAKVKVSADIDYDRITNIVRDEVRAVILDMLDPDNVLDEAFGAIVSGVESLQKDVNLLAEAIERGASTSAGDDEPEGDDKGSENEPEDEPEPTTTRRRRRI